MPQEFLEESSEWEVRPLDKSHDRAAFSCGDQRIDDFLRMQASDSMRRRLATVWVMKKKNDNKVLGYYTLSSSNTDIGELPEEIRKKIRRDNAGSTLLGRFGIDQSFQGAGNGQKLCMNALKRALTASKQVSSVGVILEARTVIAKTFWKKREFVCLGESADEPEKFFLHMPYIADIFEAP